MCESRQAKWNEKHDFKRSDKLASPHIEGIACLRHALAEQVMTNVGASTGTSSSTQKLPTSF